ncbi:hypothetical protein [Streptomyces paludis]|uniref:Uncharacterized protein n=1 Tax=Streptomyces paludis TaxID=2282738 RepID=A0A345HT82_9ACTN|nr:hypothetical protein [Streptomyces paludis]AXG79906.1 hypothetical protein DVK44_22140 [Streptomyces paludis]
MSGRTGADRTGHLDPLLDPLLDPPSDPPRDPLWRLYPAAYRAAHGREIVDVHRELTADLPRAARLRADADLAAHAVRVRLRLDSASPAGRFLGLAAPFALAAGAVDCGLRLARWYESLVRSPAPAWIQLSAATEGVWALYMLLSALVCVGAVVALTGRWPLGAGLAVCGSLGTAALWSVSAPAHSEQVATPVAALLTVAVVLACPPDLRGDRGLSAAAGAMAAVAWFPVVAVHTGAFVVTTDYGAWPLLVLAVTGVALAVRAGSPGVREAGAMAVASPPLVAYAYADAWGELLPVLGIVVPLLAGVAVLAASVRAVRGRR